MKTTRFTSFHNGFHAAFFVASFILMGAGCSDPSKIKKNGDSGGAGGSGGEVGGMGNGGSNTGGMSTASSSGNVGGMGNGGAAGSGGIGGNGGNGGAGGTTGPICGDGMVESPEACDDGNTASGDYCAADCSSVTGACGDGVLQTNESCDDGTSTMNCDSLQNGGDGKCVAAGTCSSGYVYINGACAPELLTDHVHINVSNTCVMSVMPMEYTVPAGQKLKLSYHNHSADYPIDVWMMYGGGYTDLAPGGTWNEQYEHCFGPSPSEGYADISTACSMFRLKIHCL